MKLRGRIENSEVKAKREVASKSEVESCHLQRGSRILTSLRFLRPPFPFSSLLQSYIYCASVGNTPLTQHLHKIYRSFSSVLLHPCKWGNALSGWCDVLHIAFWIFLYDGEGTTAVERSLACLLVPLTHSLQLVQKRWFATALWCAWIDFWK